MNQNGRKPAFTGGTAVIVAVVTFGLVAAMYAMAASMSMSLVYAIIALALIGTVYLATGGRARFGTRERPERIVGARLRFSDVEGHTYPSGLPDAVVREWNGREYRAEFVEPIGAGEREVVLSARHVGYPVSRVSASRTCYVNGSIGPGDGFIGGVRRVRTVGAKHQQVGRLAHSGA
jgi:hypothetical protein